MAISDGAILLILAQIGLYLTLYKNQTRIWRMIGSAGIILTGIGAVAIEDTIPAMIFMGASIIIGGIQLLKDTAEITNK